MSPPGSPPKPLSESLFDTYFKLNNFTSPSSQTSLSCYCLTMLVARFTHGPLAPFMIVSFYYDVLFVRVGIVSIFTLLDVRRRKRRLPLVQGPLSFSLWQIIYFPSKTGPQLTV